MPNLKVIYNYTLQRYYNGCNYINQHIEEADKYIFINFILKEEK